MIRQECPEYLQALLDNLSLPMPDFSVDEMKVYEQLDNAITKSVCSEMKSPSIIIGFLKLIKMAGLSAEETEIDDVLIARILENEEKLMRAAERNVPKLPPNLEKSLRVEETEIMIVPIVFGAIFSTMTFFYTMLANMYFPAITVIGTLAGLGSILFGLRGEKHFKLAAPPERFVALPPEVLTRDDMVKVLNTLKIINKINQVLRPTESRAEAARAV